MPEIVLDLETQKEFAEVGRDHPELLDISLVGIYDYADGTFRAFRKEEIEDLQEFLRACDRVVGFNIKGFDWPVLQPHLALDLSLVPVLDLMDDLAQRLGFRVSLASLAQSNLGQEKSGTGLKAIQYFREGNWEALERYCLDDVRLTRDLYELGKREGALKIFRRDTFEEQMVSVQWQPPARNSEPHAIQKALF